MKCSNETDCLLCEWWDGCSLRNNGDEILPESNEDQEYYDNDEDFNIEP